MDVFTRRDAGHVRGDAAVYLRLILACWDNACNAKQVYHLIALTQTERFHILNEPKHTNIKPGRIVPK